jgi:SAM-dependent methyltransferase
VHSVLQMNTARMAREFPKRDILLGLCLRCGFIANSIFDESVHQYGADYEETQGYSATFRRFHEELAMDLIDRHQLRHKKVIEIGCGKGEFLSLLCRLGENKGIGIDPAFVPERNPAVGANVEFIADFYSEEFAKYEADAIVCKMTLEHIHDTYGFVSLVRRSIQPGKKTLVFFQVPDAGRILEDAAFQDIYYEHCSYFTAESLASLFRSCGFDVFETRREYGGQYLTLAARPSSVPVEAERKREAFIEQLKRQTEDFSARSAKAIEEWKWLIGAVACKGKAVALWGSGSKAVAFLTALQADEQVSAVVDINPYRQGKFVAGSGHEIVSPSQLATVKPALVIAMNSMYLKEIARALSELGLQPELTAL